MWWVIMGCWRSGNWPQGKVFSKCRPGCEKEGSSQLYWVFYGDGVYSDVIFGAFLHCPGEAPEFEPVWTRRSIEGKVEILVWPKSGCSRPHKQLRTYFILIYFYSLYHTNSPRTNSTYWGAPAVPILQFNSKGNVGDAQLPGKAAGCDVQFRRRWKNAHVPLTQLLDREPGSGRSDHLLCSLWGTEGTTHLSHARKCFNTTHAPPEVILPLLLAVGTWKWALLPPTSGIDTNLHFFSAKKPLWSQVWVTMRYSFLQPHHHVYITYRAGQRNTFLCFFFFFFFLKPSEEQAGMSGRSQQVFFVLIVCQVPAKIQAVLSDERK